MSGELLAEVARQPEGDGWEVHRPPRRARLALGGDDVGATSLERWNREITHGRSATNKQAARVLLQYTQPEFISEKGSQEGRAYVSSTSLRPSSLVAMFQK